VSKTTKGGRNALHVAAERNHSAVLERILAGGEAAAAMNEKDRDGRTPLMLAAQGNAADACKTLVAGGADMELTDTSEDEDTALLIAARLGALDAARALAEAGADYYMTEDGGGSKAFDAARQGIHPSEERREEVYDALLDVMLDRE